MYRTRDYTQIDVLNAAFITEKKLKSDDANMLTESSGNLGEVELGEGAYMEGCISEVDTRHFFRKKTYFM